MNENQIKVWNIYRHWAENSPIENPVILGAAMICETIFICTDRLVAAVKG